MPFFEPLPEPPERPEVPRQPMWAGPPDGIFGEAAPVRAVLVRSQALLVVVDHIICYPTGFEFSVAIRMRRPPAPDNPVMMRGGPLMGDNAWRAGRAADTRMRLGVAFADGRKATNLDALPHFGPGGAGISVSASAPGASESGTATTFDDRQAPILVPRGGGGSGARWDHTYWVWGLPPEGPLGLVVEWPAEDVAETRVDIDGGAIRQAAGRAEVLWED